MRTLSLSSGAKISFLGPPLDVGPLPALFYFTMSHKDSPLQDPYNQVLIPLHGAPIRIFSWDLPFHPVGVDQNEGLEAWKRAHDKNEDFLTPFVEESIGYLNELKERGVLIPGAVTAAGLSRGAMAAFRMASATDLMDGVVAFAPLVQFHGLSLENYAEPLAKKWIRGFVSFNDERVQTEKVVHFFQKIGEVAKKQRVINPDIQLLLYPSIGFKGHGTPEEIFIAGGQILLKRLS